MRLFFMCQNRRMRFIIFVIDGDANTANGNEMAAIDAFNEGLERDGHWIYAAGIGDSASALRFDNRAGLGHSETGSLQDGVLHYSGFWLIKADSTEQARELAQAGSLACNRRVELRPFLGN